MRIPYGYQMDNNAFIICQEKAEVVRMIFDYYLSGTSLGKVVDMLYFPIIESTYPSWFPVVGGEEFVFFSPIFNLADTYISVGFLYLLFFQRKYFK